MGHETNMCVYIHTQTCIHILDTELKCICVILYKQYTHKDVLILKLYLLNSYPQNLCYIFLYSILEVAQIFIIPSVNC